MLVTCNSCHHVRCCILDQLQFLGHLQRQHHVQHITVVRLRHEQGVSNHGKVLLLQEGIQLANKLKLVICCSYHGHYLDIQKQTLILENSQIADRGFGSECNPS